MGFFTRLFGNVGIVRFEAMTVDGEGMTGKCPIESIGMSKEEIEERLIEAMYVDKGIRLKWLKIIAFVET